MKSFPKFWICCLVVSGLVCWVPANFAGPRGKDMQYGYSFRSQDYSELKKIKRHKKTVADKYLQTYNAPLVSIFAAAPKGNREFVPIEEMRPEYFNESMPTFRGFLQNMEERKEAELSDKLVVPDLIGENSTSSEDSLTRPDQKGDNPNMVSMESAGPSQIGSSREHESPQNTFQTTDPREAGGAIFPKPSRFGESVERFFMYFPLGKGEEAGSEPGRIMLPITSEAIFQPPGTPVMRSSATLREGT